MTDDPMHRAAGVSVIVPVFNAARTIEVAVRSALAQTATTPLEIVVVDDGSTDATPQILAGIASAEPRVRVVSQPNGGVSAARNRGLESASQPYVAMLDADDAWEPNRLETLLAIARDGADLVADNLLTCSPANGRPIGTAFPSARMETDAEISAAAFIGDDRPKHGLNSAGFIKPLVRREFLERNAVRYTVGQHVGEDFEFYVKALLCGARLRYTPAATYRYTVQTDSLSHGDPRSIVRAMDPVHDRLVAFARDRGRVDAVAALERRRIETERWLETLAFESAISRLDVRESIRQFLALPSKPRGLVRVAAVARYNILSALGRTPRPRA